MEGEPSSNILGRILQQYLSDAVSEAAGSPAIIPVAAVGIATVAVAIVAIVIEYTIAITIIISTPVATIAS